MKDTIKYEVAQAERATAADVGRALARQARMYDESRQFFERYDYFILPVTQVEPFAVDTPYPTEIAGTAMTTYIDWMRSCWDVSMMSNPAISVPAGFSATGLPVGCRSSAVIGTSGASWNWPTRSSSPHVTESADRRSPSVALVPVRRRGPAARLRPSGFVEVSP